MRNRKFQKNNVKIQKIKKYHYEFISSQTRLEKDEKERNKKLSFRSVFTRCVIKISKKEQKNTKKLKNTIVASFQAIIGWKSLRNRENKNFRSVSVLPDA